ncbi:hypothetical protein KCP91_11190 [Microvirga sp. SRT01]|uniref:Uncharacterized protein n=1 Tax=Sphingomonas longa TaxID=2778730 RepID=A0ABS2D7P3_9SPHN|nr:MULTISPECIES: DUF6489 family protein [Alphaproteobacteria]MBM6576941.1 hypothetical protein [Sphingomonas sp. BT552]MBR7709985.1 hypothetical protein [Microvirga sp. SRT01]
MKVTIEIDCTPDEARRAMGLPDLTPLHDQYVAMMQEVMQGKVQPELLEGMLKSWAPMGDAGMKFWRQMLDSAGTIGAASKG